MSDNFTGIRFDKENIGWVIFVNGQRVFTMNVPDDQSVRGTLGYVKKVARQHYGLTENQVNLHRALPKRFYFFTVT